MSRAYKRRISGLFCTMALLCAGADGATQPAYTIAFAGFGPLNSDIFIADADGRNAKPLFAHPELDYNAAFSADGRWVVFTSTRAGSADIYRAHPDGTGLERLVDDRAFDDQAALSPDGKSLAFVSSRSGQADIWILDLPTRALRNLTQHPAGEFRPSWSPDGQWVAFSSDRESPQPRVPRNDFTIRHATEVYVVKADGSNLRQLTHDEPYAGSPAWSPDGKRIAFYAAPLAEVVNITTARALRGTTQIETIELSSGARRTLTSGSGEKWSPRWLSNGNIGYVSGGPEGGVDRTGGGAGARGEFRSPSWSADGRWMVFHREVEHAWPPNRRWPTRDPQFQLMRTGVFPAYSPSGGRLLSNDKATASLHNSILGMNADGSGSTVLFTSPEKSALAPVWSPQGREVAFSLGQIFQNFSGPAIADIAMIQADGGGFSILTDGKSNYAFPSWSRDGKQIVYREAAAGRNALRIMDVATKKSRTLLEGAAHYNFPAWSPVSDVIAFTSNVDDGDYEIHTIHADGTALTRLTHAPGNDAHSAWSPDGQWIAFASARGGFKDEAALHPVNPQPYGEICVMRADGSDVRMLTDEPFEKGTPSWMPSMQ